ncbi:MAG: vWA domain-containing protein, partial [Butyricicoccus sp.]
MKKRILSLVLCAALLLSLCLFMGAGVAADAPATEDFVPAVNFTNVAPLVQANAQAANSPARAPMLTANVNAVTTRATDKGVVTSKTAAKNADGTYTITLEAYATGSKVISEIQKDVPTDIVLVLDQSGSMTDDMGTVKYEKYSEKNSTNTKNYDRRHNSGSANLWYPLSDGTYVPVNVEKSKVYNALPINLKNYTSSWGITTSDCYYYYKDALYEKVGDEYKKVTVTDTGNIFSGYIYTYTFSDGEKISSKGNDSVPELKSHAPLYALAEDGDSTVYTYTYTDADGVTQIIGTSTGANERYAKFYERSVSSSGGGTRLAALKSAATEFANSVATKAAGKDGQLGTADDVDHRIAVVGFADTDDDYGYNTGVFIGSKMTKYKNASSVYATALQSMKTTDGQNNVTASLGALQTSGATRTDLGMEMAKGILDANPVPADQTRNRVVIVFTDGSPTDFNGFQVDVANSAITTANNIKSGGATVYAIGIFAGADATSPGTKPTKNLSNDSSALPAACNWFMQNLSSNNGVVQNPSYYLSAADAESLKNIFKQISDQIETGGSSTTLSSEAVVKDIISQQFCLPAGTTAEQIRLQTYACTGKTGDTYQWSTTNDGNMGATASILSDGQVSVTGFDFAGNWCGVETQTDGTEVPRGHKLVISFEVVPKDGFLGGNDVFTNANAAIYANSTAQLPVATFERPQVNV